MTERAEEWERQPGESAAAWEAFACYRDLGLSRSISKVTGMLHKARSLIERWSAAHRWVQRAEAWDREQDRLWRGERLQAAREVARRHARLASAAQAKLVAQLQQFDPARLTPSDVIRWLEVTVRIERQAYGIDLAEAAAHAPSTADETDVTGLTDEERRARMEHLRRELEARIGTLDGEAQ
ncbi:hypothetical protein H9Y04_35555 [Streptomyces sp. TRM66268-LWL]|uniref:Uncharacterized protein n=1 Tax=Streptomyces polyasparticus TaxID=2767826 RepID=A0ABR7SQT1_9ACTN|nr:hypothetical protein [Streptomyces polyasparticus]MBC9717862.1 hypothetical protein [Streptomyces polyasparticus]